MKMVPLTNSFLTTFVDDEDFERVSMFGWYFMQNGYIGRSKNKSAPFIYLHRFIMNAPKGIEVDHKNRTPLDNQKANLRFSTRTQNVANMAPYATGKTVTGIKTSKYKGVWWNPLNKNWRMRIAINDKRINMTFKSENEAALAYNKLAGEAYGEFAYLNPV